MTVWHRYIALEGASRATGKAITGAANLGFLFIVISGMYLWLPKVWSWIQFKNVLWFRGGLAPKARDFNWHNVIGIWSAIPLAIVVAGAVPISYPWASNLVYRIVGERRRRQPPSRGCRSPSDAGEAERASSPRSCRSRASMRLVAGAVARSRAWRTMTTRLATSRTRRVVFTVDEGYGGQPQKRTTLTVESRERARSRNRRLREPERAAVARDRGCALRTPARSTA